jgi:predicted RNA binding protein YcfA (HicA-like mRNA interferase family)
MKCSQFRKILEKKGWYLVSQNGSHKKYQHKEIEGILIFPDHGSKELAKGLEKKLRKQAGL